MEVSILEIFKAMLGVVVFIFTVLLLVMIPCAAMGVTFDQLMNILDVIGMMVVVGTIGFGIFYWCFK